MSKHKPNLFSSLKNWGSIPATLIVGAIAVLIGIVLLCVGGAMAGWDIVGALTSDTAVLVYAIVLLVALVVLSYWCFRKLR